MNEKTMLMFQSAKDGGLSVSEIVSTLTQYPHYRTLRDVLESFAPEKDLRTRLVEGLLADDPAQNREAVARKVRNWLSSKPEQSISRSTAIETAFLLGLSVDEADSFLAMTNDDGFHWRNPAEIVYIYALSRQYTYPQAKALEERMSPWLQSEDPAEPAGEDLTNLVREEVSALKTEEELSLYLQQNGPKFGKYHNRAYRLFRIFLDILEKSEIEDMAEEAEREMTVKEVLREYLYRDIVPSGKAKKHILDAESLTKIQKNVLKNIASNWPDETTISRMRTRTVDVTRKALVLLFLATDGSDDVSAYEDDYDDEEELTREEVFLDSYVRLNDMLLKCGYRQMDARNPFDLMVLYALSADAVYEVDARMAATLEALFGTSQEEEE